MRFDAQDEKFRAEDEQHRRRARRRYYGASSKAYRLDEMAEPIDARAMRPMIFGEENLS